MRSSLSRRRVTLNIGQRSTATRNSSRCLRPRRLRLCLDVRPVAVDDSPSALELRVDLGRIPAGQFTFGTVRQLAVVDQVERQDRYFAMALNLRVDELVPRIREWRLH